MRLSFTAFLIAAGLAVPALAGPWTDLSEGEPDRAFYRASEEGRSLMLGCFPGASGLRMTFVAGPEPLPEAARGPGVTIWIALADGRTGRYLVDVEYMGGEENALLGTLLLGSEGMDFFARGNRLEITDPGGNLLFATGMQGTSAARRDFAATCGL